MIVRARFLRTSGGIVPHEELFAALHRPDTLAPLAPWITAWAEGSALPSTRIAAPSTWELPSFRGSRAATRPGCTPDLPSAQGVRKLYRVRPTGMREAESLTPSSGERNPHMQNGFG